MLQEFEPGGRSQAKPIKVSPLEVCIQETSPKTVADVCPGETCWIDGRDLLLFPNESCLIEWEARIRTQIRSERDILFLRTWQSAKVEIPSRCRLEWHVQEVVDPETVFGIIPEEIEWNGLRSRTVPPHLLAKPQIDKKLSWWVALGFLSLGISLFFWMFQLLGELRGFWVNRIAEWGVTLFFITLGVRCLQNWRLAENDPTGE